MTGQFELADEMRAQIGVESAPWIYEITTTGIRTFCPRRRLGRSDLLRPLGGRLPAPTGSTVLLGGPVHVPRRSDETLSEPIGTGRLPRFGLGHVLDGRTEAFHEEAVS
jgi:hypothetical protein